MSFVGASPGSIGSASAALAAVGSAIAESNAAAATPTTGIMAAANDQVSAAVARLFSGHARTYQAIGAQLAAFHRQFVSALHAGASSYALAETANASPMQQLLNLADAPSPAGHPLIGDSAVGAAPHGSPSGSTGGALGWAGRDAGGRQSRPAARESTAPAGDRYRVGGYPTAVLSARGGAGGFSVGKTGRRRGSRWSNGLGEWADDIDDTRIGGGSAGQLGGDDGSVVPTGFWYAGDTEPVGGYGRRFSGNIAEPPAGPHADAGARTAATIGPRYPRQRWITWRERERRDALARPARRRRPMQSVNSLHHRGVGAHRTLPKPAPQAFFRWAPAPLSAPTRAR